MRLPLTWWLLAMACGWPGRAGAQLQLLPDKAPQCVFAGEARTISLLWSNEGGQSVDAKIRLRLYQEGSATAVLSEGTSWKQLQVLPKQTVLESAQLDLPGVRGETKFLVQWLDGADRVIGKTEVLAYPTNLLGELRPLLGEGRFGVLDPNDALKPSLRRNGVEFLDLGETDLLDFRGRLAILGPFQSRAQMREGLPQAVQRIAAKGAAVVWLLPTPGPKEEIKPSFYLVPEGKGAVAVVQPDLVAGLAENPRSQLNLLSFCRLALNPAPFSLPNLTP